MKKSKTEIVQPKPLKRKSFPLTMSAHLFDQLKSKIFKIKSEENYSFTRQQWIHQAIREKIATEKEKLKKDSQTERKQSEQKRLSLLLEDKIVEEINALLNKRRALGDSTFSKKSWIIEAIKEKLFRDERF